MTYLTSQFDYILEIDYRGNVIYAMIIDTTDGSIMGPILNYDKTKYYTNSRIRSMIMKYTKKNRETFNIDIIEIYN